MIRFVIALFIIAISGCTSIPLKTIIEFRSFGKDEFLDIQPHDVRVRIQVDDPVRANSEDTMLKLELSTKKGVREFSFPLVLLEEVSIEPEARLFLKTKGRSEYTLHLSDGAIQQFIEAQQIIEYNQSGTFSFSVKAGFEHLPSEVAEIRFSVYLKLTEERGFVTLFDNVRLEIEHEG